MAKTFRIEILASDHPFYQGECEMVIFPGIDGEIGVLADHEPMVTCVMAGELRYKVDGEWHYAAVSDGIVEIIPNHVEILSDTIEKPEDIDRHRAELAKQRAEEKLRQQLSKQEYYQTVAAVNRAVNRLKVKSRHK
ncbi:ATP synthase F1 subunit epsilon [Anaerotignum sp.]|uniref:ATP synthase F1 subunit epsilon n=1 Tax=Anaerotignum sp. TaxID=2039241 RepID=UPI002897F4FD|nr:ATP synthase F1 subunit epsilon [Anaerotignum sp.]